MTLSNFSQAQALGEINHFCTVEQNPIFHDNNCPAFNAPHVVYRNQNNYPMTNFNSMAPTNGINRNYYPNGSRMPFENNGGAGFNLVSSSSSSVKKNYPVEKQNSIFPDSFMPNLNSKMPYDLINIPSTISNGQHNFVGSPSNNFERKMQQQRKYNNIPRYNNDLEQTSTFNDY